MPERYGITVDILTDLGLTQNQAKVYLATAKIGPATITELAKHSKVRREEIYRLLPDLEKIGLIERLMGKPMRIRTPDVRTAMSTLLRHERTKPRERISELTEKTDQIGEYLSKTGIDVVVEKKIEDDFALLEEKESVRTRLYEMIKMAEKQVDVIYSRPNLVWFLSAMSTLLIQAVSKGVRVRLISTPPSGKDRIPKIIDRRFPESSAVELKYMTGIPANYITVDGKMTMIVTSPLQQPSAHNLYTTNPNLVRLIHKIFEASWNQSSHWKTTEGIMITEMPQESMETLGTPRNILFVYLTEKRKQSVIVNFIKESLKKNHFLLYMCSETQTEDVNKYITEAGIDMSSKSNKTRLRIIYAKDFLMNGSEFSINKVIDTWDEVYFQANDDGFEGTIAVIDMQFFFESNLTSYIVEFERELNKMLDAQMSVLCVYDEKSLLQLKDPIGLFSKVVVEHGKVFTEGSG